MSNMLKISQALNELHVGTDNAMAQDAAGYVKTLEGLDELRATFVADLEVLKARTLATIDALSVSLADAYSASVRGHQALVYGNDSGVQK
jgi:hypothetical protein